MKFVLCFLVFLSLSYCMFSQVENNFDYCSALERYLADSAVQRSLGLTNTKSEPIVILVSDTNFLKCNDLKIGHKEILITNKPRWAINADGRPSSSLSSKEFESQKQSVKNYIVIFRVEMMKKGYKISGYEKQFNSSICVKYTMNKKKEFKVKEYIRGSF